jgi:hypothetical protein
MLISPLEPISALPPRRSNNPKALEDTKAPRAQSLLRTAPRGACKIRPGYFLEPPPDGAEGADTLVDRLLKVLLDDAPADEEDDHDDSDDEPE